jgi:F0F1-type ATP synthase delta subunit
VSAERLKQTKCTSTTPLEKKKKKKIKKKIKKKKKKPL